MLIDWIITIIFSLFSLMLFVSGGCITFYSILALRDEWRNRK